jgi:tRNA nucleotidyltransferase (CCA-adding enzyme)
MAMSVCGKIIDPFGGLSDIQNKSIRCVGNPDNRISEDYLRILRAIRFAIRFDFTLDEDLILSIKSNVNKLDFLAKERIYDELVKCSQMSGKKFAKVIDCMLTTKVLDVILPEISRLNEYDHDKESHPEGNVFRHTLSALECSEYRDSTTNLAILFHDVGKPDTFKLRDGKHTYYGHDKTGLVIIDSVANRLRFPSKLKSYIKFCCENHMKFHGIEKMKLSKVAKLMESPTHWDTLKRVSFCDDIARIKDRDFSRIKTKILNIKVLESKVKASLELSKFLDGKLVMSIRGIESGKDVGNILKYVKSKVLDGKIKPDYDEVVLAIKSCNLLKNGEEI